MTVSGIEVTEPGEAATGKATTRTRAPAAGPFRLRLQVIQGPEGAMGPGKAALLEAIARTGSISAAGRFLDISYRRCWLMVEEVNRCWDQPLIEAQRGGRGQGARLSARGVEIVADYRALEARLLTELTSSPEALRLGRALRPNKPTDAD